MSQVKWIKIHTGIFDDERIKIIDSMPDRDAVFVIWIKLLTLAGKVNDNGFIYVSENMPYTDEMLSSVFNRPLNTVKMSLEIFQRFNMIEICPWTINICNWDKHQNTDGLAKIREKDRERKKLERQRKKADMIIMQDTVKCHRTVTGLSMKVPALEREEERDIDNKNITDKSVIKKTTFKTPNNQEITAYFFELGFAGIEGDNFFDYYSANGWMVGKSKMKDWKAAVRNWTRNIKTTTHEQETKNYTEQDIFKIVKAKNPNCNLGILEQIVISKSIIFKNSEHKLNTFLLYAEDEKCQIKRN